MKGAVAAFRSPSRLKSPKGEVQAAFRSPKGEVAVGGATEPDATQPLVPDVDVKALIEQRKKEQAKKEPFTESVGFQIFGASLIIGNALVIGLETDIEWVYWDIVENAFLGMFLLELLIKMCSLGFCLFFVRHEDILWHWFDFLIVGLGVFDFMMSHLVGASAGGGFATIFRIIRLLRILRMFRIVKFLKQLYVLAFGLMEAVKAVFWVTVLMVFVFYICSIVLVKTIGRLPPDAHNYDFLQYRFGHILESMLTLFILMSSPNLYEYQDQDGLLANQIFLTLFMMAFIIFGSFGIIATLTGVISEGMTQKNKARLEEVRQEHEEMRRSLGSRCEVLFNSLQDFDENGEVKVEQVKTLAVDMFELLQGAGAQITHDDLIRIIEFMDLNGTGLIALGEFRSTIEKIAEGLGTMAVQELTSKVGVVEQKIDMVLEALAALDTRIRSIEEGLQCVMENWHNVKDKPVLQENCNGDLPVLQEKKDLMNDDLVGWWGEATPECKEVEVLRTGLGSPQAKSPGGNPQG